MNTVSNQIADGSPRRRTHSADFKADAVAACMQPGMSMAAVAQSRGVNANLLRRWVQAVELGASAAKPLQASRRPPSLAPFVAVTLPADALAPHEIRIELRHAATAVTVSWPINAAAQCAVWIRELLR